MRSRYAAGLTAIGAAATYILLARPRQLRWGTIEPEFDEPLPGDDLIPSPNLVATRAITVRASAEHVWPWIVQLGQGRGGFYSYDFLENLVGCDIHSADRIVLEWQDAKVGDEVKLHPEVALAVATLELGRSLVLRGGIPMGNTPSAFDNSWPSCSESGQTGRRGCWCVRDTPTYGGGRRSSSNQPRYSPS
jgi:hypothetical protein